MKKYKKEFVALVSITVFVAFSFSIHSLANAAFAKSSNNLSIELSKPQPAALKTIELTPEQLIEKASREREELVLQLQIEQQRLADAARNDIEAKLQALLDERDLIESELIKVQYELDLLLNRKRELISLFDNNFKPSEECEKPADNGTLVQCVNAKRQAKNNFLARNGFSPL